MTGEHRICEYFGCSRLACEEIDTQIGEKENISFNLCEGCANKFKCSLENMKEVSL